MADRPYRVTFRSLPIVVHAKDEKQAIQIAIEYLRQPDSGRITVEPHQSFDIPQ